MKVPGTSQLKHSSRGGPGGSWPVSACAVSRYALGPWANAGLSLSKVAPSSTKCIFYLYFQANSQAISFTTT